VNIQEFVRTKGGGFLLIAGPSFAPHAYRDTPLEEILPVKIGGSNRAAGGGASFSPKITLEGRTSPIFRLAATDEENQEIWNNLPPLYWYAQADAAKPTAQVLAEHPTESKEGKPYPLIATQFFGSGRTYFQAFDGTWRWRYRVEDLYHARYWVQTIRYLSRSKLLGKNRSVELLVDRPKYRRGEPVQVRVRFLDETLAPKTDDGVAVQVEREGAGQRTAELRRLAGHRDIFETMLTQVEDGRYRIRLSSPLVEGTMADFVVVPPPGEMDRVQMNQAELRQVAEQTEGSFFSIDEADGLFDKLPPGRRVALHTDPPFPLWRTWPMLGLFFTLLLVEWIVRKRARML
jgi:hypothetical protein